MVVLKKYSERVEGYSQLLIEFVKTVSKDFEEGRDQTTPVTEEEIKTLGEDIGQALERTLDILEMTYDDVRVGASYVTSEGKTLHERLCCACGEVDD